jgi:hypothetical protein
MNGWMDWFKSGEADHAAALCSLDGTLLYVPTGEDRTADHMQVVDSNNRRSRQKGALLKPIASHAISFVGTQFPRDKACRWKRPISLYD